MSHKIKLPLNSFQWDLLSNLVKAIPDKSPVEDYELESCVITELYKQKLASFTFFKANGDGLMNINLSYSQAFAVNLFFSDHSKDYCLYLRMYVEELLPKGKPQQILLLAR